MTLAEVYEKYCTQITCDTWVFSLTEWKPVAFDLFSAICAHIEARCVWTVVADQWSTYDAGRFNTGCGKQAWWQFSHMEQFKCCPYCGRYIGQKEVENANAE